MARETKFNCRSSYIYINKSSRPVEHILYALNVIVFFIFIEWMESIESIEMHLALDKRVYSLRKGSWFLLRNAKTIILRGHVTKDV